MKKSSIYEWYNIFKNDSTRDVADRQRPGCPSMTFDDVHDLPIVVRETIRKIPQDQFKSCFDKWIHRWEKCVSCSGEYFEKV